MLSQGYQVVSQPPPPDDQYVWQHEAGHLVAGIGLGYRVESIRAWAHPGGIGAVVGFRSAQVDRVQTKGNFRRRASRAMAGDLGVRVLRDQPTQVLQTRFLDPAIAAGGASEATVRYHIRSVLQAAGRVDDDLTAALACAVDAAGPDWEDWLQEVASETTNGLRTSRSRLRAASRRMRAAGIRGIRRVPEFRFGTCSVLWVLCAAGGGPFAAMQAYQHR